MTMLWIIIGIIGGGVLEWLFDRRFVKKNACAEQPVDEGPPS